MSDHRPPRISKNEETRHESPILRPPLVYSVPLVFPPRHVIVNMQSPTRTARISKLIPLDMFDSLVQSEGLPNSGAEYTCARTALLGKAATETSADATKIVGLLQVHHHGAHAVETHDAGPLQGERDDAGRQ